MNNALFFKSQDVPTYNTIIGNMGGIDTTASALASRLGINVSNISSFSIDGNNDIYAQIDNNYSMKNRAYRNNNTITSFVDLEQKLTLLEDECFDDCDNLLLVDVQGVTSTTGNSHFKDCNNLQRVLTSFSGALPISFFQNCLNLVEFTFNNLTSINDRGLQNCRLLPNIDLTNVTYIGINGLWNCRAMTSIDAPNLQGMSIFSPFENMSSLITANLGSVPRLGVNCFKSCENLITVNASSCTIIDSNVFEDCIELINLNVGAVTSIGSNAFNNARKINNLVFQSCISVGDQAFRDCVALDSLDIRSVQTLGSTTATNNIFTNTKQGLTITVPIAMQTAYNGGVEGDLQVVLDVNNGTIIYV